MVHLYLVSRQGIFHKAEAQEQQSAQTYGDIVLRGLIFVVLSFGIVLTLAVIFPVELSGRADPLTYQSVKPPWYFLPAYGLLKLVPKAAGVALASLGVLGLFAAPWLGRNSWVAWGLGMLGIATVALLAAYGWRW
jgi:quinol-cytochrome oxidoreductase complex cytochrome b subunit